MKPTPIASIPASQAPSVTARIAKRSLPSDSGCIIWQGPIDRGGYGKISLSLNGDGTRRHTGAHRAAWLAAVGDIPGDLQVDHLCFNRACVNIDHMELATPSENCSRTTPGLKRGAPTGAGIAGVSSCGKHGRVDGYDKVRSDGYTVWVCRPCRNERMRKWRNRKKAAESS